MFLQMQYEKVADTDQGHFKIKACLTDNDMY